MRSVNRKREWEGGQDGARPNKKTSIGASTSASSSDPDTLISPYDGHRRYDEWKGMMYGFPKVISGSGAMYPTNYKINFCTPNPWICPLVNCRKSFQQPAQLGAHFSQAHRKLLLYDEVRNGLFWVIGERKNSDKDGRFRSIVVKRGYYAPDDVRQPPEDWESYVNPTAVKDINPPNLPQPAAAPAALSSTTLAIASASRPSAAPAVATPRPLPAPAASAAAPPAIRRTAPGAGLVGRPTGNSIHEVIDISNDEADVKPSLAELQRASSSTTSGPRRAEAQREAQRLGGNEADTQKDPFQNNPFLFDDPVEPVHNRNRSIQEPVNRQVPETRSRIWEQPPQSQSLDIWTYITRFARTPTPRPDDAAIAELLTLRRRRDLPFTWRRRLGTFNTLSLHQLTAVIWYLGGDASLTSPCKRMRCHEYLMHGAVNCADPGHKDGQCRKCCSAFPKCVYLPQYLSSSQAILQRVDTYFCCNAYYRWVGFQQPKGAVRLTYVDKIAAIKANAVGNTTRECATPTSKLDIAPPTATGEPAYARSQTSASRSNQSITPSVSSKPVFFTNPAIHNKARTIREQPPKQASASSQRSSGTFCIPENTPGQLFSLKGTDTKLIQSSKNQTHSQTSASRSNQSITHSVSSKPVFSNLAIHNKPGTTHQQRPKQASASSQKSSGTFCIPEGTPGQLFSLKGTDTKLIQSSRNQILKCKVLAGDGVKVQLIGGKAFRAYKGWNEEWDIPPDSQCLVTNICPKKSFGEDQTCIYVNPKKGVLKAGQAQGTMVKGKMI